MVMAAKKGKKPAKVRKSVDRLALAAAVSDRVEIREVRLIKCECHQTPLALKGKLDLRLSHDGHMEVNRKEHQILVFPTFRASASPSEPKDSPIAVQIEAQFLLVYSAESLAGLKPENYKQFGMINGIYNAWPYWREFFQNTLTRMGLPGVTLPVFRIAPQQRNAVKKTLSKRRKVPGKKQQR